MLSECLDLKSTFAIALIIIFSVTLYGLYTIERKVLRGFARVIQDWFAFDPRWFGANPIIWLLYVIGFLDLFTCFSGKFTDLSSILTIPIGFVSLFLVLFGGLTKVNQVVENFSGDDMIMVEGRIRLYIAYEILATFFGLIFGTLGLWEYLIHDEIVKIELIIASLILPNLLSIAGRGLIRQSVIAQYFMRFVQRTDVDHMSD